MSFDKTRNFLLLLNERIEDKGLTVDRNLYYDQVGRSIIKTYFTEFVCRKLKAEDFVFYPFRRSGFCSSYNLKSGKIVCVANVATMESTLVHEILHKVWYEILTLRERIMFEESYSKWENKNKKDINEDSSASVQAGGGHTYFSATECFAYLGERIVGNEIFWEDLSDGLKYLYDQILNHPFLPYRCSICDVYIDGVADNTRHLVLSAYSVSMVLGLMVAKKKIGVVLSFRGDFLAFLKEPEIVIYDGKNLESYKMELFSIQSKVFFD